MADKKLDAAYEDIYTAIHNDNEGLDEAIDGLKSLLKEQETKEATFKTSRLAMNNRPGRQMMKSYFKKRGIVVKFDMDAAETDPIE